jgi:Tol biopolymer transport system component
MNADGSDFVELPGGPAGGMVSPSFYPDGQSLLVATGGGTTGNGQLLKVDIATGSYQTVLPSLGSEVEFLNGRVVIDPTGTMAVFEGWTGNAKRIFVVNLESQAVTELTDHHGEEWGAWDTFPSWNGSTQVTFSSNVGGGDKVYGISPDAVKQSGSLMLESAIEAWYGPN